MRIVRAFKESFLDYQDHISIVLFSFGCNMRCSFCYNYEYVTNPQNILEESAYRVIDACMTPLTNGLVFLGGEPTIYQDSLIDVARYGKTAYSLDVKLFTNGLLPKPVFQGLEENLFDRVSLDVKILSSNPKWESVFSFSWPGYGLHSYVSSLSWFLEEICRRGFSERLEVRTTVFEGMPSEEVERIRHFCDDLGIPHVVQREIPGADR